MTPVDQLLGTLVDMIVAHCAPDEVLLFGSWAKGLGHPNSDVDILVIGPFTTSRWARSRGISGALQELPVEVDLHLLTPQEYAIGRTQPHTYLNTLGETAVSLYRRA